MGTRIEIMSLESDTSKAWWNLLIFFKRKYALVKNASSVILNETSRNRRLSLWMIVKESLNVIGSKMAWDCLIKLNDLGKSKRVTFVWLSGRIGANSNVKVNVLPRKRRKRPSWILNSFVGSVTLQYWYPLPILEELKKEAEDGTGYWVQVLGVSTFHGLRQPRVLLGSYN